MKITNEGTVYLLGKGITQKEKNVINELLSGDKNREIANRLGIKEKTVKFHLTNVYRKLGVRGRPQLLAHVNPHVSTEVSETVQTDTTDTRTTLPRQAEVTASV